MPYDSIKQLPEYVKKYSKHIQRQFMYVFNTTYKKVYKETKSKKQAEGRAFQAANSVLKKRFENNRYAKDDHSDYFNYLTDSFLGKFKE